jgi:hypothetical protein
MGDESESAPERSRVPDGSHSVSTSAHQSHHPPAVVGERVADSQVSQQEFNPPAFPHHQNPAVYHLQPQYSQPDPYGMSGMRQALPDYATSAPYGYLQYQNPPPATAPVVYQGQYPPTAPYAPPIAYSGPYPPQYSQRSPVTGQFDHNVYQYYQDTYIRPSGSPILYMQQVPQYHRPAIHGGPRPSASGQQHAAQGLPGVPADGKCSLSLARQSNQHIGQNPESLWALSPAAPPESPNSPAMRSGSATCPPTPVWLS